MARGREMFRLEQLEKIACEKSKHEVSDG
ncbi:MULTISPECIES: hypothetical protein [Yersinia pseudotuberculosis complex]|uniref:Uncharacterized protein n=1 Tax=Yersinia pestis TaxID=632 RepID=A0A3G5LBW7_YERPE|nr:MULTISPECIES: hypothetical protein [Yersinia pseudotuberculosis complex]AAM86948.1 hypothetical [Yersinia pestis KIM10+]QFR87386.1 hypothetical protein DJY80_17170 [Yersinia pestis subsp. pestis bv. Medievalis]QQD42609.1 hypothetical protein AH66_015365 [Yersinia pestis EV NIIEG]AYW83822.1 hypothetical protein EGX42_13215 [Yersinia pestis]AYW86823.1 hypothetical protein EGX87_06225 [Yersinia pseudotuberculosis]